MSRYFSWSDGYAWRRSPNRPNRTLSSPLSPEFRHRTFTGIERPRPHFLPRPAGQTRFDSSAMGMGGESHDGPDAGDGAETRVNITKGA